MIATERLVLRPFEIADLPAHDRNRPVHRLLERLGLRQEGRLVEADWFKGEWTTLRIYALLARERKSRAKPVVTARDPRAPRG